MKEIRIFVASSKELLAERNRLAFYALSMEDELAERNIRLKLSKWEYVDPMMTSERTEDRYIKEMLDSDAAFVLFRSVLGKYTLEEHEKATKAIADGTSRLKVERVLFDNGGNASPELVKWKESLPRECYGEFGDFDSLRNEFSALVERLAGMDLKDVSEKSKRTVKAFFAADDNLSEDRDAFADMVLNINDTLASRGIKVKLSFYDPAHHQDILDHNEMALVLYRTTCETFGRDKMAEAFERTKQEKNPRKLYVFFRDEANAPLTREFEEFRDGFADNLGHFFCRFENVDTIKLNFVLSLESLLGYDKPNFELAKLDGRKVMMDGVEVGDITKLPMIVNNESMRGIFRKVEDVSQRFEAQREICRANPEDDDQYVKLLNISCEKNELEKQMNEELSRSLKLAKKMAAISIAEANETIAKAKQLLDQGRVAEAEKLLDDNAANELDKVLCELEDWDKEKKLKIERLGAWVDVELFRVEVIMANTDVPIKDRVEKAKLVLQSLLDRAGERLRQNLLVKYFEVYFSYYQALDKIGDIPGELSLYESLERQGLMCGNYKDEIVLSCVGVLQSFFAITLYDAGKVDVAERLLKEALSLWRELEKNKPDDFACPLAFTLDNLAFLHKNVNRLNEAVEEQREVVSLYRQLAKSDPVTYDEPLVQTLDKLADFLDSLADYHDEGNKPKLAEQSWLEALEIYRQLVEKIPNDVEPKIASVLGSLAIIHCDMDMFDKVKLECREAREIYNRLSNDKKSDLEWLSDFMSDIESLAL